MVYRFVVILCLILSGMNTTYGQAGFDLMPPVTSGDTTDGFFTPTGNKSNFLKKWDFNLDVGSNFLYSRSFGSYSGMYVAPNWTYHISPRFQTRIGTVINYTFPVSKLAGPEFNGNTQSSGRTPGIFLFSEGTYLITNRLTLSGIAYKQINATYYSLQDPAPLNYSFQGVSMGLDFKILENLTIGAQVNFHSGTEPFMYSPLNRSLIDNYYW